ncbi:MAG: hypothetical protein AAF485_28000 [Chloroflexota bacterium]
MDEFQKLRQTTKPAEIDNRNFTAEYWILMIGLACFCLFVGIISFFLLPLASGRSAPIALPQAIVEAAATQGFVLPATWTPGPTPQIEPTTTATVVYDGAAPTRLYTPRATSLSGIPMPTFMRQVYLIRM